tara:strand:+ start:219 stop:446 length:228 start_codon:yes stop_codon:yes gene_type:complete
MKVIDGGFHYKEKDGVTTVFESITKMEDLGNYEKAFCIVQSEDSVVISTNLQATDLYYLLDQIKMSIITRGDYEI